MNKDENRRTRTQAPNGLQDSREWETEGVFARADRQGRSRTPIIARIAPLPRPLSLSAHVLSVSITASLPSLSCRIPFRIGVAHPVWPVERENQPARHLILTSSPVSLDSLIRYSRKTAGGALERDEQRERGRSERSEQGRGEESLPMI